MFANAGTGGRFAPIGAYEDAVFDEVVNTNLMGPYWILHKVMPGLISRGRGAIVLTGSIASERGMAFNPAYVASKHGVLGLSRAAAIEAQSRALAEQRQLLESAQARLSDVFRALAAESLQANNQQFIELARLQLQMQDVDAARASLSAMLEVTRDPQRRELITTTLRAIAGG